MPSIAAIHRGWAAATVAWALLLPGAALVAGHGSWSAPIRAVAGLAYMAGAALCHQQPERTVFLNGVPLPVCARCTGIYWGAAATVLFLAACGPAGLRSRGPRDGRPSGASVLLAGAVAVNAGTLLWEWAIGHPPAHLVRALAGALIGMAVAWIVWLAGRPGLQSG